MAVLGFLSILIISYGIVSWATSGRRLFLSLLLWMTPICFMIMSPHTKNDINGLIILIGFMLSAETIFALQGINLWSTSYRNKGRAFVWISYITNTVFSFYFAIESYTSGYMPFLNFLGGFGIYISYLWAVISSVCASEIFITAVDRYFSKKKQFVLIKCSPFRNKNKYKLTVRGINGIRNGKNHTFYTTRKAFSLLKSEKALIMDLRVGALGGMYASGNHLFVNKSRQLKRINRTLFRRGISAFVVALITVLFIYRVLLGISFENMFAFIAAFFR